MHAPFHPRPARPAPVSRLVRGRPGRALVVLLGLLAVRAWAIEGDRRPAHLVGEENAALLARVQEVIDDWDPRRLRNPYLARVPGVGPDGAPMERSVLRRGDLAEFIADAEAAEALGKAFFWDMQAGSDFRRTGGRFVGTACASCHYRFGADARDTHTTRIPRVAWDRYRLDPRHPLPFGEKQRPFDAAAEASRTIASLEELYLPGPGGGAADERATALSLIVGSQGVPRRLFAGLNGAPPVDPTDDWQSESGMPLPLTPGGDGGGATPLPEDWEMFTAEVAGKRRDFSQVTARNAPTVVNAGFSDRLFHDGRAESTFNGFSVFGDDDRREPIHVRREPADGGAPTFEPVRIAVTHAALASQAVGPIVNEIEMSYQGRGFPDLAAKLLDAPVLGYQAIGTDDAPDSVFGPAERLGILRRGTTYRELIKRAFRREWWDGSLPGTAPSACAHAEDAARVPLLLLAPERRRDGALLEANFPLFWGLSLMLYQAGLVSNESPFDAMMQGNPAPVNARWEADREAFGQVFIDRSRTRRPPPNGTPPFEFTSGAEVFQRGFRAFIAKGCHDCHSGPLFSETFSRADNAEVGEPIGHLIGHTLLPNSRGDAIALALETEHRRVLEKVAALLVASGIAKPVVARGLALELDLLRDHAGGYQRRLESLVRRRLGELRVPEDAAPAIAGVLATFERNLPAFTGNRIFFTEDERLGMAETLVDPVLVERTPIPPRMAAEVRPRLPFASPPASEPYAFYDLGFYNLGVSPPRYDRGIGAVTSDIHASTAVVTTSAGIASVSPLPRQAKRSDLGSAYEFDPLWRFPEDRRAPEEGVATALAALASGPRGSADDSWVRAVPAWPGDFPPGTLEEHASRRRADVHFFSRARRLVLSETTWGHRKPFLSDNELLFWGSFRTPTLRNVELTGPYMHSGRLPALVDVLEFYDRGGDVRAARDTNPDKHPSMVPLGLTRDDLIAMRFFLVCLTDERVRHERAPFDHPAIRIANGYDADGVERIIDIPGTGAAGGSPPPAFPAPR